MRRTKRKQAAGTRSPKILAHLDHVDFLEVAWYRGKFARGTKRQLPASVTVECTKCGEVVAEVFNDGIDK